MVDDADSNRPPSVESGSDPAGEPSVDAADDVPASRRSTRLTIPPSHRPTCPTTCRRPGRETSRRRSWSRSSRPRSGVTTRAGAAPVRLQAAAPQDSEDVDPDLVWRLAGRRTRPGGDPAEGWTFGVSANQLGAVGEALVLGRASPPPTLRHYVARELDRPPGSFELAVETEPDPVRTPDGNGSPSTDRRSPCRRRTVPTTPRTVDPSTAARVPATNRRTFARRLPSDVRARCRRARRRPPPGAGGRRRGDRRPAPPAL